MSRSYQDLAWSCMVLQNNLIRSLPRSCQDHYKILSRSYQDLKNIFPRSLKDLVKILPGSCSFLQDLVQDLAWSYQRSCQDYNKDLAKISPRSCQDLTKVFNLGYGWTPCSFSSSLETRLHFTTESFFCELFSLLLPQPTIMHRSRVIANDIILIFQSLNR